MRVLLCVLVCVVALVVGAPTVAADDSIGGSTTSTDSGSSGAISTGTGPDPSACRPYCMAA